MAEVTAADVAKLRKACGAGMMDCKNALSRMVILKKLLNLSANVVKQSLTNVQIVKQVKALLFLKLTQQATTVQ